MYGMCKFMGLRYCKPSIYGASLHYQLQQKNTTMKTQIFFQTKPNGDYSIIATPYNVTVEWSKEKTEVFAKYGDDQMLKMWCEQVLKLQFPNYDCIITNISAKGC